MWSCLSYSVLTLLHVQIEQSNTHNGVPLAGTGVPLSDALQPDGLPLRP